jgi:hypothetical protein
MTALEWFVKQIIDGTMPIEYIIQKAKEMQKQQIERAFNESRLTHPMIGFKHETFEQYYNETFKSK